MAATFEGTFRYAVTTSMLYTLKISSDPEVAEDARQAMLTFGQPTKESPTNPEFVHGSSAEIPISKRVNIGANRPEEEEEAKMEGKRKWKRKRFYALMGMPSLES